MAIKLGKRSMARLLTCDARLADFILAVAAEAPSHLDFTVICGHRSEDDQQDAFDRGLSKKQWPFSLHNKAPSLAVDIAPFPVDWNDIYRFARLMGFAEAVAYRMGIGDKIRFGHDFNRSGRSEVKEWHDWPHIEWVG